MFKFHKKINVDETLRMNQTNPKHGVLNPSGKENTTTYINYLCDNILGDVHYKSVYVLDILNLFRTSRGEFKKLQDLSPPKAIGNILIPRDQDGEEIQHTKGVGEDPFEFKKIGVFMTVFVIILVKIHNSIHQERPILVDMVIQLPDYIVDHENPNCESILYLRHSLEVINSTLSVESPTSVHNVALSIVTPNQVCFQTAPGCKSKQVSRDIDDQVTLKKVFYYRKILNIENVHAVSCDSNRSNAINAFESSTNKPSEHWVPTSLHDGKLVVTLSGPVVDCTESTIVYDRILQKYIHSASNFFGEISDIFYNVFVPPCGIFNCSSEKSDYSIINVIMGHELGVTNGISNNGIYYTGDNLGFRSGGITDITSARHSRLTGAAYRTRDTDFLKDIRKHDRNVRLGKVKKLPNLPNPIDCVTYKDHVEINNSCLSDINLPIAANSFLENLTDFLNTLRDQVGTNDVDNLKLNPSLDRIPPRGNDPRVFFGITPPSCMR